MPYQTTWHTWPVVWFRDDVGAFMESSSFKDSSLVKQDSGLVNGQCVGLCARWLRRHFDRPDETPLARVGHVEEHFAGAVAGQFAYGQILDTQVRAEGESEDTIAEVYSAAARLS